MQKKLVIAALNEIARLMELDGENPFRVRSFTNAARELEQLTEDLGTVVREKRLRELKGVGQALEETIDELVHTRQCAYLEELRVKFPKTIHELFGISGFGPKRIKQVYDELGIDSRAKLREACESGKLQELKGFSKKLEEKILEAIAYAEAQAGQFHYDTAYNEAGRLLHYLKDSGLPTRMDLAGSLRRRREVIKDIDIVAACVDAEALMKHFVENPEVERVTGHGDTKASVVLKSGISADLRVVTPEQYPFTLAHFTGSKEHNIVMRQRAKDRGLKLNEYGLFREDDASVACDSEVHLHAALDLPYIPPELREDMGEFEIDDTPRLVEKGDLRGVVHCHTTYSDGQNTLKEMVDTTIAAGYEYLVISDHSQSAGYAGGLQPHIVVAQQQAIDDLNATLDKFRIIKGIESDIRVDGSLDYDEDILKTFEVIIASVHQKLEMDEDEATARVIRAIENPYTSILGHPTGRLLLRRKGFPLDMEKVFDACVANRVAVEINANCRRLDCDWRHLKRGKKKGVKFSIGPDAHRVEGIDYVKYGVGIARKGWLEPEDLLNTLGAEEFIAWRNSS